MNTWLSRWLGKPAESANGVEAWLAAAASPDGFERQAAVEALAASDDPRALRMLLVRANDWVAPVRQAAGQAVLAWLDERRLEGWRQALPALLRLREARRVDHGELLRAIEDFLSTPGYLARVGVGVPASEREAGRFLFMLSAKTCRGDDEGRAVLMDGLRSGDVLLARIAVQRAAALPNGPARLQLLHEACRGRFADVRVAGLRALSAGAEGVEPALLQVLCFDRSAAVRELAVAAASPALRAEVDQRALAGVPDASLSARLRVVMLRLLRARQHPDHPALCRAMSSASAVALRVAAYEGWMAEPGTDLPMLIERTLLDASPRVQRLAVKAVVRGAPAPSAERARQLVEALGTLHAMRIAQQLMGRASPWDRAWFLLTTLADGTLPEPAWQLVTQGLRAWLADMNRCFVAPTPVQRGSVAAAWRDAQAGIAEPLHAAVRFQLGSFGIPLDRTVEQDNNKESR
ncbi:hypothetical protein [Rhizobacter sp. P5_C2]